MRKTITTSTNTRQAAFFAAVSAFIAVIENWIVIPVPFFRLGLSNIPVMLALEYFSFPYIAFIVLFKAVMAHLFRGTLLSIPFFIGLGGNIMYLLVCCPFWKIFRRYCSFIAVSVLAAFMHNAAQIAVACIFLPIHTVRMIGSVLVPLGCVSGVITGIIANRIYNKYLSDGLPPMNIMQN